jgi:serine/threonine protein kinase
MSLEDEEPMSPISLASIRSESTSPTTIRTAFEEITGESYEDENGMNYRLRTKEGTTLGTNVYKVYDSIYKMAQGDRRDAIKDEIAVYEKLSELDETDRKYFLEMKSNKSRGSVVHIELEYLDGVDLVSYLDETNPSSLTLSFVARSIAYALRILARLHITHGDLHLGNIMIPMSNIICGPKNPIVSIIFIQVKYIIFIDFYMFTFLSIIHGSLLV